MKQFEEAKQQFGTAALMNFFQNVTILQTFSTKALRRILSN
jgi:hypothetical protein